MIRVYLHINDHEGKIYFNDEDYSTIDMRDVRKNYIALSEQNPLGNHKIRLGFKKLPSNSNTLKIGSKKLLEKFNKQQQQDFSGGEIKKFSIINTLSKNANLMIFDEPEASLDKNTVNKFYEVLEEIRHDKIILIVTHNVLKNIYDEIIEFNR